MTKNYSALHESMQTRTLANGLRICYLPKEGFRSEEHTSELQSQ